MKALALLLCLVCASGASALNAPSNLAASAVSQSQINLSWKDNSGNEQGFAVFQSGDNSTFTRITRTGANVTRFSATGLSAKTKYYFKVRAFNGLIVSVYSNTAATTTASPSPTPTPTSTPTATPSPTATPTPTPAPGGIAARYPGDKGIGSDPAVILADDFESYTSVDQIANNSQWTNLQKSWFCSLATGANAISGKALQMSLPISSTEPGSGLIKKFPTAPLDTLFVRIYEKFDANYHVAGSNHNGIHISGGTLPGPGIPAPKDGTGFFEFILQNNIQGRAGETDPGYDHVYAYWPKQNSSYGDHWFPDGVVTPGPSQWLTYPAQYPDFKPMPNHLPQRGKWYCYEMMFKVNTLGKNDGELKWWVDGKPTGDLPNLNVRSIASLKIDQAHVILGANQTTQVTTKWYDNIVMAKSYIGPMSSASPGPNVTPSGTPTPSPTPSPTVSPTPTISPTPSPATPTPTPSPTATPTPTSSPSPSPTPTATPPVTSSVTVSWTWPLTDGDFYRVVYGTDPRSYSGSQDAGHSSSCLVNGLMVGTTYYFALTARHATGADSPPGEETPYTMTAAAAQKLQLKD